jgi:hypothetical protein
MKRSLFFVGVLVVIACEDEAATPDAAPTAPVAAPITASHTAGVAATEIGAGASTICRVYVTERDAAKTELDAAPSDTLLQRRVKSLDGLVKETCN